MILYVVHFLMNIATVTIDGQISQLEIEVQGIPAFIFGQYTTRLRQAKNELIRYRKIHKESLATVAPANFVPGTKGSGSVGTSDDPFGECTRLDSDRSRICSTHWTCFILQVNTMMPIVFNM